MAKVAKFCLTLNKPQNGQSGKILQSMISTIIFYCSKPNCHYGVVAKMFLFKLALLSNYFGETILTDLASV